VGYLRGVIHGALIGSVVGLLYAPKPGIETRKDVSMQLEKLRGQAQPMIDQAQTTIEKARPQAERLASKAQETMGRSSSSRPSSSSS
jgi:gas vesicle protein